MTIQAFSMKSGIPKSSLRYYEEKGLLKSVRQENSNYRMYLEDQIPLAKLIASLRTARVPIREIQLYLKADENRQKQMKQQWIQLIKENQRHLEVSLRYLESDYVEEEMYIFEKPAEQVIWFEAESPPGQFSQEEEASPLFFKDYEEYFGTLHTVVYCPQDLSVLVGVGGDCEPYRLAFGEWLEETARLPHLLEGEIAAS